jgi:hypothetical protein
MDVFCNRHHMDVVEFLLPSEIILYDTEIYSLCEIFFAYVVPAKLFARLTAEKTSLCTCITIMITNNLVVLYENEIQSLLTNT